MTDIKSEIRGFRIGEKIRALRQQKRLTLQELSDITGLSKPLLSQIENEQVIPPLATLLKISKGLRVAIHYFFEDERSRQKYLLTRSEERKEAVRRPMPEDSSRPYLYHSLADGLRHKHMEPFLVEFENREWSDRLLFQHDGDEEFIYIIEGEVSFHYGEEVISMKAGDSVYYDSGQPHGFVALSPGRALALAVLYSRD